MSENNLGITALQAIAKSAREEQRTTTEKVKDTRNKLFQGLQNQYNKIHEAFITKWVSEFGTVCCDAIDSEITDGITKSANLGKTFFRYARQISFDCPCGHTSGKHEGWGTKCVGGELKRNLENTITKFLQQRYKSYEDRFRFKMDWSNYDLGFRLLIRCEFSWNEHSCDFSSSYNRDSWWEKSDVSELRKLKDVWFDEYE